MDRRDVSPLNQEVERLRMFPFFQSVFSGISNPEEIAHLLLRYKTHPKECPFYNEEVRDEEDALDFSINLFLCTKLFIQAYPQRDFIQPLFAAVDVTQENVNEECDHSLLEKIKGFDINPMVLRFILPEDISELSVQLNDCESKEVVLGALLDAALKSFAQKWEMELHGSTDEDDLQNCIQDYLNRILTFKAIPVNEENRLVIGIGYLDQVGNLSPKKNEDPAITRFKKIRSAIIRTIKENVKNLNLSTVQVTN